MPTNMSKKLHKLFRIAETQHGYFTAKQAAAAGFLPTNYTYHVKAGTWLHEGTGLYRLKNFPFSRESQMALCALWSRNRKDQIQGIYSHETALSLYDLSDVNPAKLHITVPTSFRKSSKVPKVIKLHFEDVEPKDIQILNDLKITKPMRTIFDSIKSGVSMEFIEQAVDQAYRRGLISREETETSAAPIETINLVLDLMKRANASQRKRNGA
jgi:predicted transcriptional regulator of viral defense system